MKVTVITGSRADWNGLGMVALALRASGVSVEVLAIGQHADSEESLRTVISDGFDPRLMRTNIRDEMAIGCGCATISVQGALNENPPDMVLLLGDRFEILGAACAAALLNIKIAHIGGGDITEGSIDNKLRYAITELSHLHFTTSDRANFSISDRHEPRIYTVGNPALDRIAHTEIVPRETLFLELNLAPSEKNILVAYHAATKEARPWEACMAMLDVLHSIDASYAVLGTNADTGSEAINELLTDFCALRPNRIWKGNLAPELFYSALTHFDCMVGNSSAGLVETATFGIPVVNIGNRQSGRSSPRNVRTYPATKEAIVYGIAMALAEKATPCANPYGDGKSAPRIASIIVEALKEQ